jgi:small subunit ribosomal protein S1
VQSIAGDDVFFDVGFRSPALVSLRQFDPEKKLEVGQQLTIVVDKVSPAEGLIHANLPRGRRKIQGNWDAVAVGQVVDCMVTKTNKGGLEITVSSLRGFLSASQVDMHYVSDLEKYVGEKLTVKITEANRAKRNLIVSRRAYLQEERDANAQDIWGNLEVGQAKKGVVKTLKDYGAFIDIGGVDGFLHIGEMSWNRIRHPSDLLSEGQEVDVQILTLDRDRNRIGLGMRQLSQNPWDSATSKYAQGTAVSGKVTRTTDFGAFVELEPGVEGLVHISELDYRRVNKVTDMLNVGDEPELQVLEVDLGRKRISLSLKALKEKPPELDKKPEKKSDEDLAPSAGEGYSRKRKGPLKGGTGGSEGGGLFGNPGDFS